MCSSVIAAVDLCGLAVPFAAGHPKKPKFSELSQKNTKIAITNEMLPETRNSSLDSVTALQSKKRRTRKRRDDQAILGRNSQDAKRKRRGREDLSNSHQRLCEEEQLSILPESISSEC